MKNAEKTIYDYPLYYDVLFSWDRDDEADFYDAVFHHSGLGDDDKIIEVGCGTGQVAIRLAERGWRVAGLDKRQPMLAYLERAAAKARVTALTICADMSGFTTNELFDGACCPMSSFRLLPDDQAAASHLRAMTRAVRHGGVYVLDMAFAAPDAPEITPSVGTWTMKRGGITVSAEEDKVRVEDLDRGIGMVVGWGEGPLREYTSEHFCRLVEAVGAFAVTGWHPVHRTTEDGISVFDVRCQTRPPVVGRTMVVLKRV